MRTIVLAGLLVACSACGGAPPAPKPPPPAPQSRPAPPAALAPSFPGAPATATGKQLAWVLDAIIKRHGKLERAELEAHFDAAFFAKLPADQTLKIFEQMSPQLADLALGEVQSDDEQLVARATAGGVELKLSLSLAQASKKIVGLLIERAVETGPALESFGEALRTAATLAPRAQLLVAALDHGTCKPQQELAASEPLAIGSTFKLYVLIALADRILAGKAAWTDPIVVRDEWKSLPPGTTQNEPPGAKRSLAALAERMISLSDNTAADHLLYTLGRRTVEAALRATGHKSPALDAPFLSTRELSVLKLSLPADEVERYLKLPEARRRDYLDKTLATRAPGLDIAGTWKTARKIDKLEWFASANDLCRAMAALWTRAQDPRTKQILDTLGKNRGLPIDPKVWPYVGFKGGSEPGVINMTYLLRRDDGQWFVVTLGFNADEGSALDEAKIFRLVGGVIDLLGRSR